MLDLQNISTGRQLICRMHGAEEYMQAASAKQLAPIPSLATGPFQNTQVVCKWLTGWWEGQSSSNSQQSTKWTHTRIKFCLGTSNHSGKIKGSGISVWRGMQIRFKLSGRFNLGTLEVELKKKHVDPIKRFQTSITYNMSMNLNTRTLRGSYDNGKIHLVRGQGVHMVTRVRVVSMCLCGLGNRCTELIA